MKEARNQRNIINQALQIIQHSVAELIARDLTEYDIKLYKGMEQLYKDERQLYNTEASTMFPKMTPKCPSGKEFNKGVWWNSCYGCYGRTCPNCR